MKHIKMTKSEGSFFDPQSRLSLIPGQTRPYTKPVGKLTREWLQGGGLVLIDAPKPVLVTPEPEPEPIREPRPDWSLGELKSWCQNHKLDIATWSIGELRQLASNISVGLDRKDTKTKIVDKIINKVTE